MIEATDEVHIVTSVHLLCKSSGNKINNDNDLDDKLVATSRNRHNNITIYEFRFFFSIFRLFKISKQFLTPTVTAVGIELRHNISVKTINVHKISKRYEE